MQENGDQAAHGKLQPRYPKGYWDDGFEYFRQCLILHHNDDYLEFLVKQVWKIDQVCRLAEFGCGYGRMGLVFMPLLAQGSSYTGIDQSAKLISQGRQMWAKTPWQADPDLRSRCDAERGAHDQPGHSGRCEGLLYPHGVSRQVFDA